MAGPTAIGFLGFRKNQCMKLNSTPKMLGFLGFYLPEQHEINFYRYSPTPAVAVLKML